jgi:hypothetical protein
MFSKSSLLYLAYFCLQRSAFAYSEDVCDYHNQVILQKTLVYFPVKVNVFVERNTVLNINGGIQITINNAPTSISTITTATSTVTKTHTMLDNPNT